MAKLVLSLGGMIKGEYPLEKERLTIGRKPDNDIQIDNLAVSGKHALIITILDDSFLEDLGSTNGTFVNGKLIKKHALKHGDVIGIGKHEIKYVNENAVAEDDYEKTMVVRPGPASVAMTAVRDAERTSFGDKPIPATSVIPPAMPLARLHILNGPIAGKELELTQALITLGKPGVQVAVISRRPHGYYITHIEGDGSGQNQYPIVNGDTIGAQAHYLNDHDIIELAGIKMEFTVNSQQ